MSATRHALAQGAAHAVVLHGAVHAARHRAQRLTAQPVALQPRLPRVRHALHDGTYALGQPRVAVAVGDVHAQVAQRACQPRTAVVAVLDGVAALYLTDDAAQRVALEHRLAVLVAGLAGPPREVVLVVDGGAVGQLLFSVLTETDVQSELPSASECTHEPLLNSTLCDMSDTLMRLAQTSLKLGF